MPANNEAAAVNVSTRASSVTFREIGLRPLATDRKRMTVQRNTLADNRRIGRKTLAPVAVTDHNDRIFVVLFGDRSAEQRIDAKHGKKAAGNPLRFSHFSLPIHRDIDVWIRLKSANSSQRLAPRARLLIEGAGKSAHRARRDVAPFEDDQLFGIFDRQRFDQHGINKAENRRICADAQRQ
jgi:hypothetical protein